VVLITVLVRIPRHRCIKGLKLNLARAQHSWDGPGYLRNPYFISVANGVFDQTFQEQIVISCIKNDIALYSPHTSFDAVASGVNDWLISPYGKTAFWIDCCKVCQGFRPVQGNVWPKELPTRCLNYWEARWFSFDHFWSKYHISEAAGVVVKIKFVQLRETLCKWRSSLHRLLQVKLNGLHGEQSNAVLTMTLECHSKNYNPIKYNVQP